MFKFSIEKLYHFQCTICSKWFTIADHQFTLGQWLSCPACGHHSSELRKADPITASIPVDLQ